MSTRVLDDVIIEALKYQLHCQEVLRVEPVVGGCINQGYRCETDQGFFFIKGPSLEGRPLSKGAAPVYKEGLYIEPLYKRGAV